MDIEIIAEKKTDYYLNLDDVKKKLLSKSGFKKNAPSEFDNMIFHNLSTCDINKTNNHKVCILTSNMKLKDKYQCVELYFNKFKLIGTNGSLTITRFNNTYTCITDKLVLVFKNYKILNNTDVDINGAVIFSRPEYDTFMAKFKLKNMCFNNQYYSQTQSIHVSRYDSVCHQTEERIVDLNIKSFNNINVKIIGDNNIEINSHFKTSLVQDTHLEKFLDDFDQNTENRPECSSQYQKKRFTALKYFDHLSFFEERDNPAANHIKQYLYDKLFTGKTYIDNIQSLKRESFFEYNKLKPIYKMHYLYMMNVVENKLFTNLWKAYPEKFYEIQRFFDNIYDNTKLYARYKEILIEKQEEDYRSKSFTVPFELNNELDIRHEEINIHRELHIIKMAKELHSYLAEGKIFDKEKSYPDSLINWEIMQNYLKCTKCKKILNISHSWHPSPHSINSSAPECVYCSQCKTCAGYRHRQSKQLHAKCNAGSVFTCGFLVTHYQLHCYDRCMNHICSECKPRALSEAKLMT